MDKLVVTDSELKDIEAILDELTAQYDTVEDPAFLKDSCLYAHEFPRRVRMFFNDFRLLEKPSGVCLVSGFPIDNERIGKTPNHWKWKSKPASTLKEEFLLVLFGSLLGEVLGWATQQDGHIVHDILPIPGNENEQLGTGSEEVLWWHNEDAFHPFRGDYLGMMCLRNPAQVATTLASIDMVKIDEEQSQLLLTPSFVIRPDESHLEKNRADALDPPDEPDGLLQSAYQKINLMNKAPEKLSVLFGDPQSPYLRVDPYFMDRVEDERAQDALDTLIKEIDRNLFDLVLQPGDYCFIDNFRTVHGRKPFKATYDGNDRWLKRINITKDLRKSRTARQECSSRVIF